ncbi:unnamed protein product [Aureobasidium uvarum]|uniref:BTB domain-containing protein n=1 Tax=Aureobasidium uvarum TaxID=2773716 RepID=A0A9N8PVS4_9PEZI|nr:unnamed protein product [Aureobasidium uvarum]
MSPSSGSGVSLSSMRLLYSPMVTVRVGPDKQDFCIHKELLCSKSTYFAKALSGQFKEAQTGIVELEDVHVVLFRVFVAWLYPSKVAYESSDSGASSKDEFAQLNTVLEEQHPYEAEDYENEDIPVNVSDDDLSKFEGETPQSWTYLVLGAMFVLADRLDAAELKRQTLDFMTRRKIIGIIPSDSAILYAYANTTRKSPLRQLLVNIAAYDTAFMGDHNLYNHLPVEYLSAVMVVMSKRLLHK